MNKAWAMAIVAPVAATMPLLATSARAQLPPVIVTEADNGQTRDVVVGQTVEIRLPTSAGTGYSWTKPAGKGIRAVKPPASKADVGVGAPGTVTFYVAATSTGPHRVTSMYRRPWKGGGTIKTFTITLDARVRR